MGQSAFWGRMIGPTSPTETVRRLFFEIEIAKFEFFVSAIGAFSLRSIFLILTESNIHKYKQVKGLILAQSERWRRGLGMQVEGESGGNSASKPA